MRAIFDTCILVDYLNGVSAAKKVLDRADEVWISVITWMEIMNGAETEEEQRVVTEFLNSFYVQPLTQDIAREAVKVRGKLDVGMAEATIIATARHLKCELVTWYPNPVGSGGDALPEEYRRSHNTTKKSTVPPPKP